MFNGEKELIDPDGRPVSEHQEATKQCNILLVPSLDIEKQVANLCHNMVNIGKTTLMPHYFEKVAYAVYKSNVKKYTWAQVIEGKF